MHACMHAYIHTYIHTYMHNINQISHLPPGFDPLCRPISTKQVIVWIIIGRPTQACKINRCLYIVIRLTMFTDCPRFIMFPRIL